VLGAGWYGGLKPGLLATAVCGVLGTYLFVQPFHSSWTGTSGVALITGLFLVIGATASWLCGALHTARRRTEDKQRQLAQAEEQVRSVVNHVLDAIITIDESGTVQSINPAGEKLFGYTASEVTGQNVKMLMPEPYSLDHDKYIANFLRTGQAKIIGIGREVVGRRQDGTTFPMELAVSEFGLGQRRYFTGIVRDITERKKQEERLRLLSGAAGLLLHATDPDTMLRSLFTKIGPHLGLDTYLNYMVDETGDALQLASCVGIPDETARAISRLEFGQGIAGTVAQHRQPIVATYIHQSDDPKAQWVKAFGIRAYACNPLQMNSHLLGTLSFASRSRDQFDADELNFLRTICHYVAVAYERLRLVGQLREADRRKDEFLATLAHELRNPLAPIRNGLKVMRMVGDDRDAVEQARTMMDRQLTQLVRLVDDLMDVSRITRGKVELRKEQVQLAGVVNSAVETSRPMIEQMGHELTVTLPKLPVYLDADLTRLAQVFLNLLTNAAKYTERGGQIWLTAERVGSDVVVSVKDTGTGIAADQLPRIFEMFSQLDRSLEKAQGGLGIGLTLVKRLVEMHGGRIEASSEGPGKGSEFVVRLPVIVEVSKPQTGEAMKEGDVKTSLRILIVDDNRDGADSLSMMLKMMGNDTRTAYDGEEAVAAAVEFRPDVILLDIGLPKLTGHEACRRIREESGGTGIIIIAQTGWGQEEDRQRTHKAGFDHHLVKPVDPQALMKLLAGLQAVRA